MIDLLKCLQDDIETTPLSVIETDIYRLLVSAVKSSDFQKVFVADRAFLNLLSHASYRQIGQFVGRQIAGIRLRNTLSLSSTNVSPLSPSEIGKTRSQSKQLLLRSYLYSVREVSLISPNAASLRFLIAEDFSKILSVWTPMQVENFIARAFDSCVFEITCSSVMFEKILGAQDPKELCLRRVERELQSAYEFARAYV